MKKTIFKKTDKIKEGVETSKLSNDTKKVYKIFVRPFLSTHNNHIVAVTFKKWGELKKDHAHLKRRVTLWADLVLGVTLLIYQVAQAVEHDFVPPTKFPKQNIYSLLLVTF
jgi:hypothetical protein